MENKNQPPVKSTVFISYAREDGEFVRALRAGLEERGVESKGDWLLTTGEDYETRLRELNLEAHALLFVISPDSIKSEACRNELALAVEHKKRILPISRRDHGDDNLLDSALRAPQWTFLREGNDFARGVGELVTGVNTDFDLMETHGRLLLAADNWRNNGRNRSYLLRKDGLRSAEAWLAVTSAQPDKLPQPTPLEIEFIFASRRARSRGTRIGLGIATAVALALAALSVVALAQRSRAVASAGEANTQRLKAQENESKAIANAEEAELRKKEAEDNFKEAERQREEAESQRKEAETQRNQAEAARIAEREQREEADKQRGLAVEGRKEAEHQTGIARTRLANIYWNNGVKAREQGQPMLAAHQFMRAAEAFAEVGDEDSSRNSQLAAEFLAGDYELQGVVEMKGDMRGGLFGPKQSDLALWSYDEIHNFDGTSTLATWDIDRRDFRMQPLSFRERIRDCLMNTDALLLCWTTVGSDGSALHLWESATGRELFKPVRFESDDVRFSGAAFSHDRKRIVAWAGGAFMDVDAEAFARVYDARTGAPLTPPLKHGDVLNGAVFSRDDSRVLTWGEDGFAKLWNSADGTQLAVMDMGAEVDGALFSPDESRIVTWGGSDTRGVARLWDARTGAPLCPPLEHELLVGGAVFSADGGKIVTWTRRRYVASESASARVWDAVEGKPLTPPLKHEGNVLGAQFNADAKYVMTWSGDRNVRVWFIADRESPAFQKPLTHAADILDAHYTADGASIVSVTKDGALHLWDAHTGILVSESVLNQQPIRGQTHTPDLLTFATWGADGTTRIWRRRVGRKFVASMRHPGARGFRLNHAGTRLLTWDSKGTIRIWDTSTGEEVASRERSGPPTRQGESESSARDVRHEITDAVFSPDDRRAVVLFKSFIGSASPDESYVLDTETGERLGASFGLGDDMRGAVYSADGSTFLTWSEMWSNEDAAEVHFVRVWDGSSGLPITPPIKHGRSIVRAAFAPGAMTFMTFDFESVRAWDARTGRAVPLPAGISWRDTDSYGNWALHGDRHATVSPDAVTLKDASGNRVLRSAKAGVGTRPLFSPDGSRLLVIFNGVETENAAEVWDAATGKLLGGLKGEKLNVGGAAFNPDGTRLLTWGGIDHALHLWESDTGRELVPPLRDPQGFSSATFSADGKRVLTRGSAGLRFWDALTGEPLTAALASRAADEKLTTDGTRILGHSFGVAELRDARSGQLILPALRLRWPNDDVYREGGDELVSDDGTRLVDWNGEGRIRVWNLWTDYGWPRDRLRLRLEVLTGARLNSFDEMELLSHEDWEKARADYEAVGRETRP